MTTTRPTSPPAASDPAPAQPFRLPDIPERHPDDTTSYDNLHQYGAAANIVLAGDRLEGGGYEPIEVTEIGPGVFQGYSAALNLNLRAANGYLGWHDPATDEHIPTLQSQTARAENAEARIQELEAEIHRLREDR